ncbi:hypothetical protein [Nocardia gamkensis]|uniref:Uncharacterized protein n=1 Tax=Nocardia gamkensis TaxID=352869 RepID=A0A7X6R4P3_9NOCA|nr:hypothetical protein [Nocardia gamkensis]NKY28526.1 hypothetical protein [Nocardia gamkensis]NQE69089.1 hypothetical protein [Nocardia gamkensis]
MRGKTTESTIDVDTSPHPLDDPVRASLRGEHRRFAGWVGRIGRYDLEVARFVDHPQVLDEQDWTDLATLLGPGGSTALRGHGHLPRTAGRCSTTRSRRHRLP